MRNTFPFAWTTVTFIISVRIFTSYDRSWMKSLIKNLHLKNKTLWFKSQRFFYFFFSYRQHSTKIAQVIKVTMIPRVNSGGQNDNVTWWRPGVIGIAKNVPKASRGLTFCPSTLALHPLLNGIVVIITSLSCGISMLPRNCNRPLWVRFHWLFITE